MKHIKEIKTKDGTIKIEVTFWADPFFKDFHGKSFRYDTSVWFTPAGKRKATMDRSKATDEELLQAKLELHKLIEPTL